MRLCVVSGCGLKHRSDRPSTALARHDCGGFWHSRRFNDLVYYTASWQLRKVVAFFVWGLSGTMQFVVVRRISMVYANKKVA